jgi:Uncharacterized protein conserved in bacteria (DUF2330)
VRRSFLATVVVLAGFLVVPATALACGMPLEAEITREQALIVHDGSEETIVASLDLDPAGGEQAAVVFPIPAEGEVDVVEGGADLFTYLERATAPPPEETPSGDDAAAAPEATGGGVDVLSREVIGGYDVARLRADDPAALDTWLEENGYATPEGAEPILAGYIEDDWAFVAIKLAPDAEPGALEPLRLRFPSEEIVYPTRLDALAEGPVPVRYWVLSDKRVGAPGLESVYAGPVADLEPQPPEALRELLATAPYITRLEADAVPEQALANDLVVKTVSTGDAWSGTGPGGNGDGEDLSVGWIVLAAVVVAGLLALALVKRRRET